MISCCLLTILVVYLLSCLTESLRSLKAEWEEKNSLCGTWNLLGSALTWCLLDLIFFKVAVRHKSKEMTKCADGVSTVSELGLMYFNTAV